MKIIPIIAALVIIYLSGCSDKVTSPPVENIYGVRGHILDTAGTPISGVKIYCLFDYTHIPDSVDQSRQADQPIIDSVFYNDLYQNFPNPLSKDTYLRFSLREQSAVELTVSSKLNGDIVYQMRDTLYYGLYQKYLAIGNDPNVKNGIYRYNFRIVSSGGDITQLEKEMLIINDKNKANSISDGNGYYIFNDDEAFINDTVKECRVYNPSVVYDHLLSESIYLLFIKEGFQSRQILMTLYNGILLNQDVIMERENMQ